MADANGPPRELLTRLRKIEGQIRGIQRLVEQDAPCGDVLTQIAAAVAALERVAVRLVRAYAERCLREAAQGGRGAADRLDDLEDALERFLRA